MTGIQVTPAAAMRRSWLTMLVICTGYFLVILDATVVNVALPAIGRSLHAQVTGLQWVVDGYALVLAALLLSGGALAERIGGRRAFTIGLAIFATASAACACAPGLGVLLAARVAQGAGAAVLVPSSLMLLQAAYPDRRSRARALGVWGAVAGVGAAAGPVIGGLMVTAWSWRGAFWLNLPFALGALATATRLLPATQPGKRALDLPGQLLGLAGLGLLTASLVEAGRLGWAAPPVLAGFAISALAWLIFAVIETRAADPMLPPLLARRAAFQAGSAVGLLINLGFYGQLFVLTLYFQDQRGYDALRTGLALLPEAVLLVLATTLSGRFIARTGPRLPMLTGLSIGAAGLAGLSTAGSRTGYALMVAPMAAAGFGMALTMPAMTALVLESAPAGRAGIAAGALNSARQVGGALGVALLGTLVSGVNFMAGLHVALGAAAMAFVLGALVTIAGVRPPRPELPSLSRDRHAEFRRDMARRLTSSPRETSSW